MRVGTGGVLEVGVPEAEPGLGEAVREPVFDPETCGDPVWVSERRGVTLRVVVWVGVGVREGGDADGVEESDGACDAVLDTDSGEAVLALRLALKVGEAESEERKDPVGVKLRLRGGLHEAVGLQDLVGVQLAVCVPDHSGDPVALGEGLLVRVGEAVGDGECVSVCLGDPREYVTEELQVAVDSEKEAEAVDGERDRADALLLGVAEEDTETVRLEGVNIMVLELRELVGD